ncbi:response regulator [Cytophagaceae bacterium ABcell3]|nr:response regulator [Cytophagaceae bacterium ABcell3]
MKLEKISSLPVNVLLVDDKPENLYALEEMLQDKHIHFIKTTSGYEALKQALKYDIALVLLDVQMPEMNGYEVAKLLKQNNKTKNVPIIFVTALNQEPDYVAEGYETGAVDFLFKPLNNTITRAKVKAFIQLYFQQKDLEEKNAWLENLGMLVNTSIDLMCILDSESLNIDIANSAWEKVLGYKQEDVSGKTFPKFIKSSLDISRILKEAEEKNNRIVNLELEVICEDGSLLWFSWVLVYKKGKWYANGRDIGKRKEYEDALNKVNEELEQRVQERTSELTRINKDLKEEVVLRMTAEEELKSINQQLLKTNADLDNFVYTASHDLKLPIANMEALVSSLQEEVTDDEGDVIQMLNMLKKSSRQLKETIDDLLAIIKQQKNGSSKKEQVDCDKVLDEIISSIKDLIEDTGAIIYKDFKECNILNFPRANLKSIIYNLLTNAIKYRSPDRTPEIHIRMRKQGEYYLLSVRDNGLGISKKDQGKLFARFKRLHDHVEGSGIGLYIVKETVEKHGGKVELESEEGKGSEFKIFFKP